uniref:receptor protein-tyrosine kinase n=1 Tax=Parastrongyloides trichosuri TaxID=131310 RepID=A0A0N4ZIK1_PARTI
MLLIIILLLYYPSTTFCTIFSNTLNSCNDACVDRNLAIPLKSNQLMWEGNYFEKCNYSCHIVSCQEGCKDLEGIQSNCTGRCDGTSSPEACYQGCRNVIDTFLHTLQELINHVSLSVDVNEHEGIKVKFEFEEQYTGILQDIGTTNIQYYAQSKSSTLSSGWKWSKLGEEAFKDKISSSFIYVPFEESPSVVFRLALVWRNFTIVSRSLTRHLPTQPYIFSEPKVTSSLQLDKDKYVICYEILRISNPEFKIILKKDDGKVIHEHVTTSSCSVFKNLTINNCCKVSINVIDKDKDIKETPTLIYDIKLKEISYTNEEDGKSSLIFTNSTHLFEVKDLNDYIMLNDPILLNFIAPENTKITVIINVDKYNLLIALNDGSIIKYNIKNYMDKNEIMINNGEDENNHNGTENTLTTIPLPTSLIDNLIKLKDNDGIPILDISIDPFQGYFYFIQENHGIFRCSLINGCSKEYLTKMITEIGKDIKKISLDYINGELYLTNSIGELFGTSLLPYNITGDYTFPVVKKIDNGLKDKKSKLIYGSTVNIEENKLIVTTKNGSLMSMNIVTGRWRNIRSNVNLNDIYKEVKKFYLYNNRLFWISTSCGDTHPWEFCLYSEESDSNGNNIHLNRYLYAGPVVSFTFLKNYDTPKFIQPPAKVGLIVSGFDCRITWLPIKPLPYQNNDIRWMNIFYEVKLESENGGSQEIKGLSSNESSIVLKIKPNIKYTALVRVCIPGIDICSEYSKGENTGFQLLENDKDLIKEKIIMYSWKKGSDENLTINNILGIEMNDGLDYYPQIPIDTSAIIAYENSTKSIYFSKSNIISIAKINSNSPSFRFMDYITVSHLILMSKRASIIIASSYSISVYRLTSTFDYQIYQCYNDTCGEVIGVTGDDDSGEIFYLTQNRNGTVQLFNFNEETKESSFIAESDDFPSVNQIVVIEEKFLFLTKLGNVGMCDKTLGNININLAVKDVLFLLPLQKLYDPNSTESTNFLLNDNRITFDGDIEFGKNERSELSWKTIPKIAFNSAIYKVQLFKDSFVGDRNVEVSLNTTLDIPQKILNKWNSKQKFDVIVDAITPWTLATCNMTGIIAPIKPPSPPSNLEIYATQQTTVDGARAIVDLFWDEPQESNGDILSYQVNCTNLESGISKIEVINVRKSRTFSIATKSGKIVCCVAASNEPGIFGKYSDPISIDSSELKPLVRLFAIDSIGNMMALTNWSDGISGKKIKRQAEPAYQSMDFVSTELYAIRREPDNNQLFIVLLDLNDITTILHKVAINGEFSQIEAITSDWVANRLLIVANHQVMQISLELFTSLSVVTPKKLFSLSTASQDAKQLLFDPFTFHGYLLTKNGSLFSLNFKEGTEQNLALSIDCLRSQTVTSTMTEYIWNRATSPLIYALTWNGLITIDPKTKTCKDISIDWSVFGEKGIKSISSFSIADKLFVFVTSSQLLIYNRNSATASPISIVNPPLKQILAVSQSSQPSPDRSCFALPPSTNIKFNLKNEDKSGALIEITEPTIPSSCSAISFPPTQYEVHFKRKNTDKVKHIQSISNIIHVENGILDRDTDYEVSITWLNRYFPPTSQSEPKYLKTGYGYPSAPQNFNAFSVSPDTIILYWLLPQVLNAPIDEIRYKITQQSSSLTSPSGIGARNYINGAFSSSSTDVIVCNENPCQAKVTNLRPSTDYKFWVTAIHESHLKNQLILDDTEAMSNESNVRTKDIPGTLRPDNVTSDYIILRFSSLEPESEPVKLAVEYRQSGVDSNYISPANVSFTPADMEGSKTITVTLENLRSATTYDYRLVATYNGEYEFQGKNKSYTETFFQTAQQIKTKPGTPSAPQLVTTTKDQEGWIVRWEAPLSDGGAVITSYAVDLRQNSSSEWEIAERGLTADKLWWRPIITGSNYLPMNPMYVEYRIRATNSEGFGNYAYSKLDPKLLENEKNEKINILFWIVLLSILLLLVLFCGIIVFMGYKKKVKRDKRKEKINKTISLDMIGQLNRFPQRMSELPLELKNELNTLPKVNKDDVRYVKFLGSGSFGEVYEGEGKNIPMYGNKTISFAIKSLKPGYSEDDRIKFLKEAILMNNFDHRNIVKLLGVCFDNDTNFLLIELMEGGDLLKFLRDSRPADGVPSKLSLKELISIMVDIGRGASYLEMNRHVHRDIAARNCLITSKLPANRIAKIADFGLARDVYNGDYYRVSGDDFLPLRWLAPEAAKDGYFSNKSDLWSFGILLWEILTLGQTPYGKRKNYEVISYVNSGGLPDKPEYCPDEIYDIVKECLIFNVSERPSFSMILPKLEDLRCKPDYNDDEPFPPVNECFGHHNQGFEMSMASLGTNSMSDSLRLESRKDSNNSRFDKSNRSMGRRNNKPSLLRSFRKDKKTSQPEPLPTMEEVNLSIRKSINRKHSNMRPESVLSSNTLSTSLDPDYELTGPHRSSSLGFNNEGFNNDYLNYYERPVSTSNPVYFNPYKNKAPLPPKNSNDINKSQNSSSTNSEDNGDNSLKTGRVSCV